MSAKAKKKIVIVGAGIAGLTAGAYIKRSGHELLLLEKTSDCGGLVSSFSRDGFLFDTGPRAFGNAGILIPMLEDLGIELPLVKGEVSTGIRDHIVHYESNADIDDFIFSLQKLFPEDIDEIEEIDRYIRKYTRMTATLNKVSNPFFKNPLKYWKYLLTKFLPWLPSFFSVVLRTSILCKSIEEVLKSISANQSLNDMVSQHFFKETPASFAFGYFENYQDYKYPLGGTRELPKAIEQNILFKGGVIQKNTEVIRIDPYEKILTDQNGKAYSYDLLLWAADLKTLYRSIDCEKYSSKLQNSIRAEGQKYLSVSAGESVFSIFLAVDEAPAVFRNISKGHFIYTPQLEGLGELHRKQLEQIKQNFDKTAKHELFEWLKNFCVYNSYEISIPVLKDSSLAPESKTGLIISLMFDGEIFEMVEKAGWYDEFREKTMEYILDNLEKSIYPGFKDKIIFKESATPITLMNMFKTTNGAITGWSLEEKPPVPNSLAGITSTAKTAIPYIYKAGQWSYSPSGVPIAILTGKIAAGAIQKKALRLG
ncbi:MAG: NAD(P)/FAD-dependent oxidoreductase [Spirochaetales bacterium]|nr:NAD(P)/FAD-dependent oxidoreductase [Spirochaetales bacterium]